MKKFFKFFAVVLLLSFSLSALGAKAPKYVFYMIGDGMGINQVFSTSQYNIANGGQAVNFWNFPVRSIVATYSANSVTTDSAAAGTALATGTKTNNGRIGTAPDGTALKNVAEWAKEKGYGTGSVTSEAMNGATPSVFYAHVDDRDQTKDIFYQFIDSKIDFVGGCNIDVPNETDFKQWTADASAKGIDVFVGKDSYKTTDKRTLYVGGVWTNALPKAIDNKGEMKLTDLTRAAIDHLYSNYGKKGFFVMIEGGKIDWCCHSNDTKSTFDEINAFADAMDLVLEFYRQHQDETLIVVTSDHETGAMSLPKPRYTLLNGQNCSMDTLSAELSSLCSSEDRSWEKVKEHLSSRLGLWSSIKVKPEAEEHLKEVYERVAAGHDAGVKDLYALNNTLAHDAITYLSDNVAGTHWSTTHHSGAPVGLYVIGQGCEQFQGLTDNTQIPLTIEKVAGYRK